MEHDILNRLAFPLVFWVATSDLGRKGCFGDPMTTGCESAKKFWDHLEWIQAKYQKLMHMQFERFSENRDHSFEISLDRSR